LCRLGVRQMAGTASINGIISGMNTDDIVTKIMDIARQPVTRLTASQTGLTQKLTAWQELNTRLLALQTTAGSLSNSATFASNAVSSSDEDILTGTATTTAAAGTYYINVATKAQTQQLASQGFAEVTDAVGTGTVHVSIADGTTFDVEISSSNNTLTGLRDAINKADKGVSAVIVNSGDALTPYKLLVTSSGSGTGHEMTIDTSGLDSVDRPVIDQVVQDATDATLVLGSGAGKISVTKSTNTITDLIPGVTLSIKDADENKTITLQVSPNNDAISKKIGDFVTQYNNAVDFIKSQFNFDLVGNQQGVLFGDFRLQTIQADLAGFIVNPSQGITQDLKALSQVGITMDTDGKLSVNSSKLSDALTDNLSQVNALFSTGFDSTDANVSFFSASPDTQATTSAGYAVSVTAAAIRAQVTSGVDQIGLLSQGETLILNGRTILLDAGMTQTQVTTRINEYTQWTGVTALATGADGTGTGNFLTLRNSKYGAAGHITAQSRVSNASGVTSGLGTTVVTEAAFTGESGLGTGNAGQNMVGTINGVAATVDGQYLIAGVGVDKKDPAQGLRLRIDSSVPITSTVHFTKGVGLLVKDFITKATESKGSVTSAQDTISSEITDVKKQITDWNKRLEDKQAQLYSQFSKMEDALGRLQSQGNSITALLNGMSSSG